MRKEKILPTEKVTERYLQYPDEWVDTVPYDRVARKDSKLRTPEDNKLLDRGHFRDNVRIFRNQKN
jgi:predicted nucleotidyltransferase